jgi:hypothetical protein
MRSTFDYDSPGARSCVTSATMTKECIKACKLSRFCTYCMKRTCTRLAAAHKLIKMASTLAQQQSYSARKQVVEMAAVCWHVHTQHSHVHSRVADPHASSSFSTASFHSQGLGTITTRHAPEARVTNGPRFKQQSHCDSASRNELRLTRSSWRSTAIQRCCYPARGRSSLMFYAQPASMQGHVQTSPAT